jgi:hypothetical protein
LDGAFAESGLRPVRNASKVQKPGNSLCLNAFVASIEVTY